MAMTPEGSSVGSWIAPSHEYFGGVLVVGTPNSVVSVMDANPVAVSESWAVAVMSPLRSGSCSTGVSPLVWMAARLPLMPVMLRVHSPVVLVVHAGELPGPA